VLVWWTGSDVVVGEITAYEITAAAASYGHRVVLWDNFPVNDFDAARVFLGPLTGRDTALDGVPLAGITANPMVEAAASRLALTTVADYAWNPSAYDPARSHRRAVRLTPGAAELAPLVAACSAWPPDAPQSPALAALCAAALTGEHDGLRAELSRLATLPTDVGGPLARELAPWVAAARDMAAAGLAALDLGRSEPPGLSRSEPSGMSRSEPPSLSPSGALEGARVVEALARAEAHEVNVLRDVIPPFVRAVLKGPTISPPSADPHR
jgi:hyaluronoglucosaminidase